MMMKPQIILSASMSTLLVASHPSSPPPFISQTIDSRFDKGSYSIVSGNISHSKFPDIVTGSLAGPIRWYKQVNHNDSNPFAPSYNVFEIANLPGTAHEMLLDVNGDGYDDLIVAHAFNGCPMNCSTDNGMFSWLENPKGQFNISWKIHPMAKPIGIPHRITSLVSHEQTWIFSVPVVGLREPNMKDVLRECKITISAFLMPSTKKGPVDVLSYDWKASEVVLDDSLHTCHEAKPIQWKGEPALLVGCQEGGIAYFPAHIHNNNTLNSTSVSWQKERILPPFQFPNEDNTGVSSIAMNKEGAMSFIGPFHGSHVGYSLPHAQKQQQRTWKNLTTIGEGGHDIQMGQFLKTTSTLPMKDQIVAAFRSSDPGIHFFSFDQDGSSRRQKIYSGPTTMMTLADFNHDGKLDIASINWGEAGDSSVVVHYGTSS